jgi:hypothetical protein
LIETKNRISISESNKKEYIKLLDLNKSLLWHNSYFQL